MLREMAPSCSFCSISPLHYMLNNVLLSPYNFPTRELPVEPLTKARFVCSIYRPFWAVCRLASDYNVLMADVVANRKPPTLTMSFVSGSHHAPRMSTMSSAESDSDDAGSPITALDSSAALILVHDQDEPPSPLDFTDDEDDREEDDLISPIFEVRRSTVFPALPPTTVFLYLLAPYLKLGAVDLPNSSLPLKFGLPALLLSALASAFARQIWYMLARYLRKADMTEVLLDTFAKGRGKERRRSFIRILVRLGTGSVSTLVAIAYLRCKHLLVSKKQFKFILFRFNVFATSATHLEASLWFLIFHFDHGC